MSSPTLILLAAALALHITGALGHGFLAQPKSRNYLWNTAYCPMCLNGGGPAVVSQGAKFPFGKAHYCGDPYEGNQPHAAGGRSAQRVITARYMEGQVVQFDVAITAYHKGRFSFRVCKINGKGHLREQQDLTEECLNKYTLVQANVPGAQAPGDPYFHIGNNPASMYSMYYQLPKGLSCTGKNRCVLQWYWLTGNTCNPPGEPAQYATEGLETCGQEQWYGAYPEEFWNCADIQIQRSGDPTDVPEEDRPNLPPSVPIPSGPVPPMPTGDPPCKPGDSACVCQWLGMDGFFPDKQSQCKKFHFCSQGRSFYRECPIVQGQSTQFDVQTMSCHFTEHADCPEPGPPSSAPAGPKPPSPSPSPPPGAGCHPKDADCFCKDKPTEGFYGDVNDNCAGFFMCAKSRFSYTACPLGTRFNTDTGACDWEADGPKCNSSKRGVQIEAVVGPAFGGGEVLLEVLPPNAAGGIGMRPGGVLGGKRSAWRF